ncbi:hypothetical protein J5N97_019966 [Dioscorea zingiberensis]|uniref:Uncharacterized protein n=1 Tax=Dioscorea zingiberensis TaxID=325984 RepID=A0A9D5CEV1_9LILI|nr:hypothetical protein J5N97_019966 [Dioscorea zingiberensis]
MILPLPLLRHDVQPSLLRSSARRSRHHRVLASLRGDHWKLSNINPEAVQERLSSWLVKAQTLLAEVAAPLVKPAQGRKTGIEKEIDGVDGEEELFTAVEMTVERRVPNGYLSLAAVLSIEQFGRLNGLTGRKVQRIFEALAPEHVRYDARSMVEYCCFRYLSRDSYDFHLSLKELAFQKLIFITMLAWEQPYSTGSDSQVDSENSSLQRRLVGEDAFVRIAPAVAGVADVSTAHHLFKALAGAESGISLSLWITYIAELLKVHEGRKSYQTDNVVQNEQLLCIGSSRKRPVLKWEDNIAWPGNLTLTDTALYFEAIGLRGAKNTIRLDLKSHGSQVKKTKVGPLGSKLFDSAVSVSSGQLSETWVLEFVDFGGEMRRDVWHAFISEVISLYKFIREFGPADGDPSIHYVYGAQKGKKRAVRSVANSIARLQSLQFIRRLAEDPSKLVQFSYLQNVPYGDVVLQTLAVNFWGGQLITKFSKEGYLSTRWGVPEELLVGGSHIFDIDGSVYLRKWMRSPTWGTSASVAFWKNTSVKQGIVLSKNLVVADLNLVGRAALTCKEKSWIVEKTQATIDAAMIKGIPSNIDLFKELMLPCVIVAEKFDQLRRWEEPRWTISFLVFAYTVIFRNLLSYAFPSMLMFMGTTMLLLKGLKEQGRLGRSFGNVTIRDQPPSNTIQKIIALKEAMSDTEDFLQKINISLLKIRTIILAGQPEITRDVALLLLSGSIVLLVVPFKYILAFVLFDLFTRDLEFRREMVIRFKTFLKEKWASVYAAPVVVLPYEGDKSNSEATTTSEGDQANTERIHRNSTKS